MPRKRREEEMADEACCQSSQEGCCGGGHGWHSKWRGRHHGHHGHSGALYGLGVVGAAVFFFQQSAGFWGGVLAILKGFAWPAFVVYKALALLGF